MTSFSHKHCKLNIKDEPNLSPKHALNKQWNNFQHERIDIAMKSYLRAISVLVFTL